MMEKQMAFTLVNPQNGHLAFKIFDFEGASYFDHVQRNNYYSLIIIQEGVGTAKSDFSNYEFEEKTVFAFSPYQPFMFTPFDNLKGSAILFHPDFFCIHKHHNEVACNGVLFNNIYHPPFLRINESQEKHLLDLIGEMKLEVQDPGLAQYELLISHLKILLIRLSRIKADQSPQAKLNLAETEQPFILQNLRDAIENNYRIKHAAGEYASLLNISPKALGKITKAHFKKTVTNLVSERIIIEAKRELYLTSKTIKEIAWELGYEDEYHFSRFFKTNTEISPQIYRRTVGFAAAGG